jgi:secondary thiamine-phosphate synthase enzyme
MRATRNYAESIQTAQRCEMIDITARVQRQLVRSEIRDGFALVFVPHTTAAVTINENADPDVKSDLLQKLETLVPQREAYYKHAEGNSDSHVKTSLVGNTVTVLVEDGRLILGQWQGIYFCEFDGPRQRQFMVKLVGEGPQNRG